MNLKMTIPVVAISFFVGILRWAEHNFNVADGCEVAIDTSPFRASSRLKKSLLKFGPSELIAKGNVTLTIPYREITSV